MYYPGVFSNTCSMLHGGVCSSDAARLTSVEKSDFHDVFILDVVEEMIL